MATRQEFLDAFAKAAPDMNITVESKSGKRYWVHSDQLAGIPDGLIYGIPHKKAPRAKGVAGEVVWMAPENVKIVSA